MNEKRFAFGKNWSDYLDQAFTEETLKNAETSLKDFIGKDSLAGLTFLDVGCGSGIHSLAARNLGAARIVSIDYDVNSVTCTERLAKDSNPEVWMVKQGSVLDKEFMASLGTFDIVYCWGVAHHTGDMWTALENLVYNCKPAGLLHIAIYNTLAGGLGSSWWEKVKSFHNSMPSFIQKILQWGYYVYHIVKILTRFKNPITVFRRYKKKRGMSYRHDLVDWIGGYPYEHAKVEEIFRFYHNRHGMELLNIKTSNFVGNNHFLFKTKQ